MAVIEPWFLPGQFNQYSWVWGGLEVGHAVHAPYHQGAMRSYHRAMLNAMWNRQKFCIIPTMHSSYNGLLAPTNPAGTTLRIASGAALVDGFLYTNDGNVDFALATAGYYRLVLRRDWDEKIVRATVIGPSTIGYPELRYDVEPQNKGNYIDVPVAKVYSSGAALTITDERTFFRNLIIKHRQGVSDSFYPPGTTTLVVNNLAIQVGAVIPESTLEGVLFAEEYADVSGMGIGGGPPIVFVMPLSSSAPGTGSLRVGVTFFAGVSDTAYLAMDSIANLDSIIWMAIGGLVRRVINTV